MTKIEVRPATEADVDAVTAVHLSSTRVAYEGLFPPHMLSGAAEKRREAWRSYLAGSSPPRWTLVVTEDDEIVGFAALGPSRDADVGENAGEVYAMYLEPRVWRRGIGRRLLAESERVLAQAGHREASLWVLEANDRGRAFYEAAGWTADGAQKRHEPSGGLLELRYRRTLAPG